MEKATDAVIGLDDIFAAGMDLRDEKAVRKTVANLTKLEPCLAGYLDREVIHVAGRLALAGCSPALCRETVNMVLNVVLTTFAAQRLASNRLWNEAMAGTPLANLMNPIPPSANE